MTTPDISSAILRGLESARWPTGDPLSPGDPMVDLAPEFLGVVAEAAAREVLAEVTRVLVDVYPNPDRPPSVVDIGARLGIRAIATELGVDLDAALMKLTTAMIREAADGIDSLVQIEVRSYAGRGMGGKECVAVVVPAAGDLVRLGMSLAYGVAQNPSSSPGWEAACDDIDTAISEFPTPRVESLRFDLIAYWPSVPFDDEASDEPGLSRAPIAEGAGS